MWGEYRIDTNTWYTTEYIAAPIYNAECETITGYSGNTFYIIYSYPSYTIDQSNGKVIFDPQEQKRTIVDTTTRKLSVGGWVEFLTKETEVRWVDTIEFIDGSRQRICYSKTLSITKTSVPHSSTSISNVVIRIHLNEPTAEENRGNFTKFPLVI